MDTNMYKLVEDAIKSGKSVDDLIAEMRQTADTVCKNTPSVKEDILKHVKMNGLKLCGIANEYGTIDTDQLVDTIAAWMVQNGFEPDGAIKSREEVAEAIKCLLEDDLKICKTGVKLVQMPNGLSINSLLSGLFDMNLPKR